VCHPIHNMLLCDEMLSSAGSTDISHVRVVLFYWYAAEQVCCDALCDIVDEIVLITETFDW
jgi:hypothetical protein